MEDIRLDRNDIFLLVRGLLFAEKKRLHACSDIFGDELLVTPASEPGRAPLNLSSDEIGESARTLAGFFALNPDAAGRLERLKSVADWVSLVAGEWLPRPDGITFFTSGSTGMPKPIRRSLFHLVRDAVFLASLPGSVSRIVTQVPYHHIYGFICALLIPRLLNVPCLDRRFAAPAELAGELASGDLLLGTPFTWNLLAGFAPEFPPGVTGITSTAPCPARLITELEAKGLEKMVEIYGSTECGAIGYRHRSDEPLTLTPLWKKTEAGDLVRGLPDGSLSEPFPFQDELEWLGRDRFLVVKRLDGAVQVGGYNVYPGKVAEVIESCHLVARCAVRPMRPEEGDRLKAFIVLREGVEPDEEVREALREFIAIRLDHPEQPKDLRFGATLPVTGIGKAADW